MPERCPVAHRIDELEFAGCAACAWREYHVVNDARMDLGVQISAANLEVSRLTARLTVLAGERDQVLAVIDKLALALAREDFESRAEADAELMRLAHSWRTADSAH